MSDDDHNIVSLTGAPVHFTIQRPDGQLFTPHDVLEGLPIDDCDEIMVIGRTRSGQLYVGATHNSAACSLLLGQATNFIHRAFETF